ncbi:MAG: hypothetical protein EA393_16905, partial [Bacteroidetes bacterium]
METRPFLVYKSSAGSGKTYTLVKEYLKIILQEPQKIRNILAITFTNAAAAEMKERVIEALGDISALAGKEEIQWKGKGKGLLEIIQNETNLQPHEIIRRAELALTLILHNYGDFSISTIDSFVHRVIRSFAFDLRLPLNFDVELDQKQLLKQAVDILVSRAGSDPALTRLLVQFIEHRTDQEKSHYIEYDIINIADNLMDEKGSFYVERLKNISLDEFGKIHRQLDEHIKAFEKKVSMLAADALKIIENSGVDEGMFFYGTRGLPGYFRKLVKGDIAKGIVPNSYVMKTIEEDKWTANKADAVTVAAIDNISGQLKDVFYQIANSAAHGLETYMVQGLVKQNIFPMAVLSELEKVIDEIKSENSVLPISDFNKKIAEIVAVETAPFIYERIGERFQHYMIDEFQDTSGLQWQNLLPLVDNSLASGNMNLLVGDGKQAIYRWRNGDVEQFASLPQIPANIKAQARELWQATLQRNYNEQNLDTNYRSRQEVVKFNNSFFEFAKELLPEGLDKIYQGQEQKFRDDKTGGFVQMEFVAADDDTELKYEELTRHRILDTIIDLQEKGHPLSDITILCRSNKQASEVARFLLENGLNVISSESLLLNQSPRVNFILSLMKLLNNPSDNAAYVEFLQFLVKDRKISTGLHDALHALKAHQTGNNGDVFSLEALENFLQQQGIKFSFGQCLYMGFYELTETILGSFIPRKPIDPFVAFFMDVVYDYNNKFVASVSGFLEWWEENATKFSVVVPEGVDAVQVMTIHKSKGLQFPVVIYPFADTGFSKLSKNGEWVELENIPGTEPLDVAWVRISKALYETRFEEVYTEEQGKTLLDTLNIMYVAFTRAVDKLFVFSKYPGKSSGGDNVPTLLVNFLQQRQVFQDGQDIYSFGENHITERESFPDGSLNDASAEVFGEYISSPWTEKVSIRSLQAEKEPDIRSAESSERGSMIHDIMERIHTLDDVEKILQQMLQSGRIDESEKDILHSKILGVLKDPLIQPWYAAGSDARNECGMYDEQGRFFRADRVVLQDTTAVIIDYKTGEPYPQHAQQLNKYASVIKKMGYSDIKKYIVYLDHGKIEL